jgi:hypothetical protein
VVNKAIKGVDRQQKVELSKNKGGFRHFQLGGEGKGCKKRGRVKKGVNLHILFIQ